MMNRFEDRLEDLSSGYPLIFTLPFTSQFDIGPFSRKFLDDAEFTRFQSIHSPLKQAQFFWGRAGIKSIFAKIAGRLPEEVTIDIEKDGRPIVKNHPLHFSISHSKNLIAFALSNSTIGIDLEENRVLKQIDVLADKVLKGPERELFEKCGPDNQSEIFLKFWSLKEAFGKCIGTGLAWDFTGLTATPDSSGEFFHNEKHQLSGNYLLTEKYIISYALAKKDFRPIQTDILELPIHWPILHHNFSISSTTLPRPISSSRSNALGV